MLFIALPISYVASFRHGHGLAGLWIGYSVSALSLTVMYSTVLMTLDWPEIAQEASTSEESSTSSEDE